MRKISFGTEGFRGIIGYDFNFQTVEKIVNAISTYVVENKGKKLLVGYDTRFLSKEFAEHAASTASRHGLEVLISESCCPSPVLSYAVKNLGFNGGIMITASHNPPKYNGIKFKSHYGGAVSNTVTERLSSIMERIALLDTHPEHYDKTIDIKSAYRRGIEKFVDRKLHDFQRLRIVIDPMHGAGREFLASIFEELGHEVIEIRNTINPSFDGTSPEPVENNLLPLKQAVKQNKADIGIALDGDADRIALVNENAEYVDAHRVFGLLIVYLAEEMGLRTDVAKTVSGSEIIDKLCEHYGLSLHTTKIGFKHICELMQHKDVMIGGEESGGIGIASHIPERDGLLAGILITQMMIKRKKTLQTLVNDMSNITGKYYYKRKDLHIKNISQLCDLIITNKSKLMSRFGDYELDNMDGCKFRFKDGGFLMARPSGTEPILRVYAELKQKDKMERMIDEFIKRLENITGRTV